MLERKLRINKKREYQEVFAKGLCYVSRLVVVYIYKDKLTGGDKSACKVSVTDLSSDLSRVGFIASKKVGNAVSRNRAKRQLREAVRQRMPFNPPCLMVCIARPAMKNATFNDINKSLGYLLKKGGVECYTRSLLP
jgi:ribonuclease P protein component